MNTLRTLIITLNPAGDRVGKIRAELTLQGIDSDCFPAVDGRQGLPPLLPGESVDKKKCFQYRLSELTGSEIGCYLSHLRAIKQAYDAGTTHLCLLEDDVVIEPAFGDIVRELLTLNDTFEFVRLMGLKRHKRKIVTSLRNHYLLTRPVKGLCGTQGYVINRIGMKKVIEAGSRLCKPIDKLYDHFWEFDLKAFAVEPHIIWENTQSTTVSKGRRSGNTRKKIDYAEFKTRKFLRSCKRKMYLLKNFRHFYPAQKPNKNVSKTRRYH